MCRCLSCNVIMSEYEMSRKYKDTTIDVGLCNRCFTGLDIPSDVNWSLPRNSQIDLDDGFDEELFDNPDIGSYSLTMEDV